MRYVVALCLALCSGPLLSQTIYKVTSSASISTDNWYPLSESEMKAAAVDTSLAEFTQYGQFRIVQTTDQGNTQPDGSLVSRISLIGPAEVVKLTLHLDLANGASYVSSVSMDIHGLDYKGIYDAFEFVGTEAARRLNAQLSLSLSKPEPDKPDSSPSGDEGSTNLFNQAQKLKREGHYHQARALFEQIAGQPGSSDWKVIAADELVYGLPLYEADNMVLDNSLQNTTSLLDNMIKVTHLYRQILADNSNKAQRVVDINQRLDQMSISIKHIRNAIRASALSRAMPLRMMLMEHLMETGEWPQPAALTGIINHLGGHYEVIRYQPGRDTFELLIKEAQSSVELLLAGGMQGITIQAHNQNP